MDLQRMISELQAERERLDEAIEALERLSATGKLKRRGRPPAWLRQQGSQDSAEEANEAEERTDVDTGRASKKAASG